MGTMRYEVQVGDEIIEFEGPDNLSEQQITVLADSALRRAKPGETFNPSVLDPRYKDQPTTEAPVEAPEYSEDDSSGLGAYLRGLTRDSTFNFGDEIAAWGNAYIPGMAEFDNLGETVPHQVGALDSESFADFFSGGRKRYEQNLAAIRSQHEADDELHPVATGAGRISGALSTLPRAGAAVGSRLPYHLRLAYEGRPITTAIGLGTAGGAVSGAGAGEEGTRAQSAAMGGLTGGAVGGTVAGGIASAPVVANYARVLLNTGQSATREAIAQITRALARDGYDVSSPSAVQALRQHLSDYTGKPVSLADVGSATRSRTGVGLRTPSAVQTQSIDRVLSRQAGQSQRLAGDIRANVAPRTDVHTLDDELVEQRATEAARLRDRALFENVEAPPPVPRTQVVPTGQISGEADNAGVLRTLGEATPDNPTFARVPVPAQAGVPATQRQARMVYDEQLNWLARHPFAQKALNKALDLANAERDRLAATGQSIDHLPDYTPGGTMDMRVFDTLKRYLDQEVGRAFRGQSDTYTVAQASEVKAIRDAIRDRLREVNPEYGEYLDQYAGSSEMIGALEQGRKFTQLDPEQIAAQQASRSQAGQELYRVGAARDLMDTIRSTRDSANPASRILNSDEARAQLRATGIDPQNATALERAVQQERTLNLVPAELSGAQTAQRVVAQADADAGANLNIPFNPGSPIGWAGAIGRSVLNRASLARNEAVNNQLMPRMLETDPRTVDEVINEILAQNERTQIQLARRSLRQRQAGGLSGVMVGGPVALPEEDY